MEENGKSDKASRPQPEVQELVERCKAMEKELAELNRRMLEIQRQVQSELRRRKEKPDNR